MRKLKVFVHENENKKISRTEWERTKKLPPEQIEMFSLEYKWFVYWLEITYGALLDVDCRRGRVRATVILPEIWLCSDPLGEVAICEQWFDCTLSNYIILISMHIRKAYIPIHKHTFDGIIFLPLRMPAIGLPHRLFPLGDHCKHHWKVRPCKLADYSNNVVPPDAP